MLRVLIVGLCLCAASVVCTDATVAQSTSPLEKAPLDAAPIDVAPLVALAKIELPKYKKATPPPYPDRARRYHRDGWVLLELTATADGKAHDAVVLESYPTGFFFEQAALDAVPLWEFTPGRKNGEAVAMRFRIISRFCLEGRDGITPENGHVFEKTFNALRAKDVKTTDEGLARMRQMYEAQTLNLAEVARYHAFLASSHYRKADYAAVVEASPRVIFLSRFLDNKKAVDITHLELVASYIGLGRNNDAVDYYDTWRKKSETKPSQQLVDIIEQLRAAGAGTGQTASLLSYLELDNEGE